MPGPPNVDDPEEPSDDSDDSPEDDLTYYLGEHGDDTTDDATDDADPARAAADRRTRRTALIGLAVVVVIVALAITLTSLLVDTSPADPGPRSAVQRWSATLAAGDTAARRRLECTHPTDVGDVLTRLLAGSRYRIVAGQARAEGKDRWSVPVRVDSADGSRVTATSVAVVRESGRYLVC